MGRDHPLSAFVVCVGSLRHVDGLPYLSLGQIVVLPQIPDPWIAFHINHRNQYN